MAIAGAQRGFFGVEALLFAVSTSATIVWCASMSGIAGMPMPGGCTMSMAWMRMPGQTWLGAAAAFLGMWIVMMVAMMLPSLVPMLWRYREAVGGAGATHLGRLTTLVVVTAAITVERLAPAGERVARLVGAVGIGGGAWLDRPCHRTRLSLRH